MSAITHVFITSILIASSVQSTDRYRLYGNGFDHIPRDCRMPDVTRNDSYNVYHEFIDRYNLDDMWLPIKRHKLENWTWVDDTNYGRSVSRPGHVVPGQDCGLLRFDEEIIDDTYCNKSGAAFICMTTRPVPLPPVTKRSSLDEPFYLNGYMYKINPPVDNWYDAEQSCRAEPGHQLAVLADKQEKKELCQRLTGSSYSKAWIGLRNTVYEQTSHTGNPTIIQKYNWEKKEPKTGDEFMCVTITSHGKWRSVRCDSRFPYICLDPVSRTTVDTTKDEITISRTTAHTTKDEITTSSSLPATSTQRIKDPLLTVHLPSMTSLVSLGLFIIIILLITITVLTLSLKYYKKERYNTLPRAGEALTDDSRRGFLFTPTPIFQSHGAGGGRVPSAWVMFKRSSSAKDKILLRFMNTKLTSEIAE